MKHKLNLIYVKILSLFFLSDVQATSKEEDLSNFSQTYRVSEETSFKKKWDWKDYSQASKAGVIRGLIGLSFEHPLDYIKTHLQADPKISSDISAIKSIYTTKGIKGFFEGILPNGFKSIIKQSYRYPLMFYLPDMYQNILPSGFKESNSASKKALTGVTIAVLETYLLCPLERLKVHLMTSEEIKRHSILNFVNDNRFSLRKELFRGIHALLLKQVVSWTTFLVADHKIKFFARRIADIPLNEKLSLPTLIFSGTIVGIITALAISPFDSAKTQLQMSKHLSTTKLSEAITIIYNQHGVRGLYRGWKIRMIQYILNSVFTAIVLEKLEKKAN